MNKEILFRGKRIDNCEWVKGYYFCLHDTPRKPHIIKVYNFDRPDMEQYVGEFEVDPKTITQYTGFRSCVGNRIFYNDIVKIKANRSVNGRRQSKHDHEVDLYVVVTDETLWNWNHVSWKYKDDKYVLPTKEDEPNYPNCQELLVEKGLELVDRTVCGRPIREMLRNYDKDLENAGKDDKNKNMWLRQAKDNEVVIVGNIYDGVVEV